MNESQLLYEVMRELGRFGYVVRCNAGSIKLPSGKRFRGLPPGFADLMLIMQGGRVAFIECKVGKNKPSEEQERFIKRMREYGHLAGVAYSVADALTIAGITN
jgi:hypothetical protein